MCRVHFNTLLDGKEGWPAGQSCFRRFSGVIIAVAQILVGHQKKFFKNRDTQIPKQTNLLCLSSDSSGIAICGQKPAGGSPGPWSRWWASWSPSESQGGFETQLPQKCLVIVASQSLEGWFLPTELLASICTGNSSPQPPGEWSQICQAARCGVPGAVGVRRGGEAGGVHLYSGGKTVSCFLYQPR